MRLNHKTARALLITFLFCLSPFPLYGQDDGAFALTADSLRDGQGAELHRLQWRYHAADEAAWADPHFDDGSWEVLNGTRITAREQPRSGWRGIGWFRLRLQVDSQLAGEPLGFEFWNLGASELYVDGKLVKQFGRVGADVESEQVFNPIRVPFGIVFDEGEHLIAVRLSVMTAANLNSFVAGLANSNNTVGAGFGLRVKKLDDAVAVQRTLLIRMAGIQTPMGVLFLAVAILHLLLFLFYPRLRANLFFGLYAFTRFVPLLLGFIFNVSHSGVWLYAALNYIRFSFILLAAASLLTYLYIAFNRRIPAHFKIYIAVCVLTLVLFPLFPDSQAIDFWMRSAILLFTAIEGGRVIVGAVVRKEEGAWIVGIGFLSILPLVIFTAIRPTLGSVPASLDNLLSLSGDIGLLLANSIYLARQFARTNKNLEAKLVEVETLSAERLEQERAAAELRLEREQERAERALIEQELALAADIQKGLFPAELPSAPGYEIAARNRPARLCGGDYYDVIPVEDGDDSDGSTLLLCVADVAGKGLDASLLMSNMQATLHALSGHTRPLAELAAQINKRLYAASPPNKFVTAILLEINLATSEGRYINAGHNSCLLTRASGNTIELLQSTGLPFGMMPGARYEELSFRLQAGDILTLYSDGVSEAYDEQEQEWGETKLQDCLRDGMSESAENIVRKVFEEIDSFAGTAPQHDDITLLVFKKSERASNNTDEPAVILQNVA